MCSFMMSEGRSRQPNSNANEQEQQQQQQQAQNNNSSLPPVNFCDIMTVFEKAVQEVRCGQIAMRKNIAAAAAAIAGSPHAAISGDRDVTYFNRTLIIILHLICLLTKLAAAHLSTEQIFNVKQGWRDTIRAIVAWLQFGEGIRVRARSARILLHEFGD